MIFTYTKDTIKRWGLGYLKNTFERMCACRVSTSTPLDTRGRIGCGEKKKGQKGFKKHSARHEGKDRLWKIDVLVSVIIFSSQNQKKG